MTFDVATDPHRLISKFVPRLRAHVITDYASLNERGYILLSIDDLIQAASIRLIALATGWADIVANQPHYELQSDGTYDGLFYAYLKRHTRQACSKLLQAERRAHLDSLTVQRDDVEHERAALYETTDGEIHDRTGVRRRPDGPWWPAIVNEIMSFWDQMNPKYKVAIALLHYDGLRPDQVYELTGVNTDLTIKEWRLHAQERLVLSEDREERKVTRGAAWEPPEQLIHYIRAEHQMDIHEFLGIVTISFRIDPDYLVSVLDRAPNRAGRSQITLWQAETIDRMAAEGQTYSAIARATGVSAPSVRYRLRADVREHRRSSRLGNRSTAEQ